jgi:hypothetical protein
MGCVCVCIRVYDLPFSLHRIYTHIHTHSLSPFLSCRYYRDPFPKNNSNLVLANTILTQKDALEAVQAEIAQIRALSVTTKRSLSSYVSSVCVWSKGCGVL